MAYEFKCISSGITLINTMYLFQSKQEFFDSPVWQGDRYYDAKPFKPWFGWIYISLYEHLGLEEYKKDPNPNVQMKIGHTSDLKRRNTELFAEKTSKGKKQLPSSIVYAWSVPMSKQFESDIKTFLRNFIRPDNTRIGSSEIIWGIPLIALINVMQLSILKTAIRLKMIKTDLTLTLKPPDVIKDMGKTYPGSKKYMLPHVLVVDDIFKSLNMEKRENEMSLADYIFVQEERLPRGENETSEYDEYDEYGEYDDDGDDGEEAVEAQEAQAGEAGEEDQSAEYAVKHSEYMSGKVYRLGSYVYAKYKDNNYYLAKIVGYGTEKVPNKYAIKWLETTDDDPAEPIPDGDGFKLDEKFPAEWKERKDVKSVSSIRKAIADKFKIRVGKQVDVPRPEAYSLIKLRL